MSDDEFVIFLVDDDRAVLKAVGRLLATEGYTVRSYSSGTEFLADHDLAVQGCAILDVSLPDLNGLELQERLSTDRDGRPIIFITGLGDIPSSVKAMKAGAIDFLTKPVRSADLLAAIESARQRCVTARASRDKLQSIEARVAKLTPREKQVLLSVACGKLNKQIAADLGIAIKTIKLHRGRMMKKMSVRSVAELVHLLEVAHISRDAHPPN